MTLNSLRLMMPRLLPLLVLLLAHAPHAAAMNTWRTAALPELLRATALCASAEQGVEWQDADLDASLWALLSAEAVSPPPAWTEHPSESESGPAEPIEGASPLLRLPILAASQRLRDGP